MKTIRIKLSMLFAIFMILLVFCGMFLNDLFLERYYIYKSKNDFINTIGKINEEYTNNRKNIDNFIDTIDRVEGINCIITDKNQNIKYNSFSQELELDSIRLPGEIQQIVRKNKNKLLSAYVYSIAEKTDNQAPKLVFISRLDNGEYIILRKSLKGII